MVALILCPDRSSGESLILLWLYYQCFSRSISGNRECLEERDLVHQVTSGRQTNSSSLVKNARKNIKKGEPDQQLCSFVYIVTVNDLLHIYSNTNLEWLKRRGFLSVCSHGGIRERESRNHQWKETTKKQDHSFKCSIWCKPCASFWCSRKLSQVPSITSVWFSQNLRQSVNVKTIRLTLCQSAALFLLCVLQITFTCWIFAVSDKERCHFIEKGFVKEGFIQLSSPLKVSHMAATQLASPPQQHCPELPSPTTTPPPCTSTEAPLTR